ncbi:putative disease resistance RPP13-like protein 1 [Chenopodium quinoa]|uniref:putative disease resistance RPP13-like protein 1 n=1 Tax=Chenopodium quinoa TaxID=63459 RepID=UPI000B77E4D9|nr:putative disease resistance RPP13-like protein 1 [Chenopodium quinoa]
MTTRNENIARMMINNPALCNIPKLETLSSDDCWLIFQQHAKVEFDLAQMRDNIIEKVNGLPLAAKALGGLLKSIPDKSQRRKILESSVWGEKSSVLPVLRLSYHHMPSYLKRVFSYCSVLPKDYKFMEMEVILLWMAQGFLPETQNERMEDMGHKYFNHLVSRSLYEQIPSDEGKYIMHDLIHDVAQLSAEFKRMKMLPQSINNLWNLQTLCLKGCYKLERVPYIGSLSKLRYMYISEFSLKEMPLGIEKLTNMQTLEKFVLATGKVADALDAQLHKKKSLDGLYLKWGTYVDEVDDKTNRDVAEKLQPHISIKKSELDGYMGSTFPSWLGDLSFSNMVDIKLNKCQKCECLPPLGQLSTLKSLWIEKMNGIKEWVHPPVGNNRAFPILEKLSIKHCPSLQGDLPPHLPSIRKLGIIECRRLESLELKNLSSSTCRLEVLYVKGCESIVFIGHIPLTLQPLEIDDGEKLGCVDYDEQTINLSARSDNEKALKSEQPTKVSLELPLLTELRIERCPSLRSLQENLLLPALKIFTCGIAEIWKGFPLNCTILTPSNDFILKNALKSIA